MSSIPRHFALKSVSNNSYLQYVKEDNELRGFLQYSGDQALSPFTKFEIEKSNAGKRFVHIRCCYNNKYWVLHSPSSHYIVATAKEREEDQSNPSCTLFKLIHDEDEDGDEFMDVKKICFRHVHLNRNLHLKPFGEHQGCLFTGAEETDNESDLSTIINWDTLFVLPKYVAFKSNNNHYLRPVHLDGSRFIALSFIGSDKEDPGLRHEVITSPDGHVRIKNVPYGMFLMLHDIKGLILDHEKNLKDDDPRTLFMPIKLGDNKVALKSMSNNCFCRRFSDYHDRVNADIDYINDEANIEVEELVLSRDIYNIRFHLSDARVYNEQPVSMSSALVENNNSEDQKLSMKLSYEDTTTSTWNANVNGMFGVEMKIETGVPKVSQGEVELAVELTENYSWGKTQQFKYLAEVVHDVVVPAFTKVKGSILATQASCDVPFSYTQRDKLMNGKSITRHFHDGVYTVVNSYNYHFLTEEVD